MTGFYKKCSTVLKWVKQNPKCRLIEPTKGEIGGVRKKYLEQIITDVNNITKFNEWINPCTVIKWFQNITSKNNCIFIKFDISEFYHSTAEELSEKSLYFVKIVTITDGSIVQIIKHERKSLLFDNGVGVKNDNPLFDVTMGSFNGAEVSELVGLYLLSKISVLIDLDNIRLNRCL